MRRAVGSEKSLMILDGGYFSVVIREFFVLEDSGVPENLVEAVGLSTVSGGARMKSGTSAVEVMVAVLVVAAVGIPMLSVLFQGRDTEQRSRFEWLAVLAARDEIYQARLLAACGASPASLVHEFRPQTGNPLDPIRGLFTGNVPAVSYYPVQERIQTRLSVQGPLAGGSPRIHRSSISARWRDEAAAQREKRKTSIDIQFGVMTPP